MSIGDSKLAKILTKVASFKDVQKSLQEVQKALDKLGESVNKKTDNPGEEYEGKPGDIRTVLDDRDSYSFEINTKDGWKRPYLRTDIADDVEIVLRNRPALVSKPKEKKLILIPEDTGKVMLAEPDYISAWIDVQTSSSNGGTLTHDLGVIPMLGQVQVCRDAYYNDGDPTEVIFYPVTSRMPKNFWHGYDVGPMMHFTKTTVGWWLHYNGGIFQNYGSITQADSSTVAETGYFRLLLWK